MANYKTKIEYLQEAIDSILNQTYRNFELIIIDDCSQDESVDYIKSINDNRVRLLINDKNSGPAVTRNRGLEVAKGKYIAIMDSDDISMPTRLEKQVAYMEMNPDVFVCGTWFEKFGVENKIRKPVIDDFEMYRCQLLFSDTPITLCSPSAMIRKSILDENSIRYDETLLKTEDYGLWVDCSKVGTFFILNEVLLKYRTHESQTSIKDKDEQYDFANLISRRQLQALQIDECEEEDRWRHSNICDKNDLIRFALWLTNIKNQNEKKQIYDCAALECYLDLMLNRAIHRLSMAKRLSLLFVRNQTIMSFYHRKFKRYFRGNKK